jgi:hypothetical protein
MEWRGEILQRNQQGEEHSAPELMFFDLNLQMHRERQIFIASRITRLGFRTCGKIPNLDVEPEP